MADAGSRHLHPAPANTNTWMQWKRNTASPGATSWFLNSVMSFSQPCQLQARATPINSLTQLDLPMGAPSSHNLVLASHTSNIPLKKTAFGFKDLHTASSSYEKTYFSLEIQPLCKDPAFQKARNSGPVRSLWFRKFQRLLQPIVFLTPRFLLV